MSKFCFISFTKNPRACIVHPEAQVDTLNGYKLLRISQDLRALTMSESWNNETLSQGLQAKMHHLEVWRGWRHLRQMQVSVDWESRLTWTSSKISKKPSVPNCQLLSFVELPLRTDSCWRKAHEFTIQNRFDPFVLFIIFHSSLLFSSFYYGSSSHSGEWAAKIDHHVVCTACRGSNMRGTPLPMQNTYFQLLELLNPWTPKLCKGPH